MVYPFVHGLYDVLRFTNRLLYAAEEMTAGNVRAFPVFQFRFPGFVQISGHVHGFLIRSHNAGDFRRLHGLGFNLQSPDASSLKLHGMGQHGERLAVEYMHMAELVHAQGEKCLLAVFQSITSLGAGMAASTFAYIAEERTRHTVFGNHEFQPAMDNGRQRQRTVFR